MQIWAYEAMPKLGEMLAIREQHTILPRWFCWHTKDLSKGHSFKSYLELLESTEVSTNYEFVYASGLQILFWLLTHVSLHRIFSVSSQTYSTTFIGGEEKRIL